MTTQHIETLVGPPTVGTSYRVPTVLYPWFGVEDAWPVMGPKHTDGEHIGFPYEHYHVDIRFLTAAQARRIERKAYGDPISYVAAQSPLAMSKVPGEMLVHPAPVEKRLKCRRADNNYPSGLGGINRGLKNLAVAFLGRKCGRDAQNRMICPHKGFVLDSMVPDAKGRIVCPLHGLVIDVASATVVKEG